MTEPELPDLPSVVIDPRPRRILDQYLALVGGTVVDIGDGILEVTLPSTELSFWENRRRLRIATTPEAMEVDAEAELLAIGSVAFLQLVEAVRSRGALRSEGFVQPSVETVAALAEPPVPVIGATADAGAAETRVVRLGRLLARLSVHAGPKLEERLIESPVVDLATGLPFPDAITQALAGVTGNVRVPPELEVVERRSLAELVASLTAELRTGIEPELRTIQTEADQALGIELARIDRYFTQMIDELDPRDTPQQTRDAKRAIEAEYARRREGEIERHRLHIAVHPLQLTEWLVGAQQVRWPLTTPTGVTAELTATRLLVGDSDWTLACPACGGAPVSVGVCSEGHVACPACSARCGVCSATACLTHGLATCEVEGHPVCGKHSMTCRSCGVAHCETHAGFCDLGDHPVCPTCATSCGRCGTGLCKAHGVRTGDGAPLGARWLCKACTVLCEGGTNEPVGLDEVVECSSCERHICTFHQVTCAVDGRTHCSGHLRKSDRTGRLACHDHQASCAAEPHSVMASDEVDGCASCGAMICEVHRHACASDGAFHCLSHMTALADVPGSYGCEEHRTTCHIDNVSFSIEGTRECAVCSKSSCERHRAICGSCARQVCTSDITDQKCVTCTRMVELVDPPDDLIHAAIVANSGEPPKVKRWHWSRDSTGTVVELDLGWTRRLVITVPHGESMPRTVVQHSALGSKRVR